MDTVTRASNSNASSKNRFTTIKNLCPILTLSNATSCETRDREIGAKVRTVDESCTRSHVRMYFRENVGKNILHNVLGKNI